MAVNDQMIVSGLPDDPIHILTAKLNALIAAYNATLTKLDADVGVTDTNYAATNPGPTVVADALVGGTVA